MGAFAVRLCHIVKCHKREQSVMPTETEAKLLIGFEFLRHPDNPVLGLLHLRTEREDLWVLVTRKQLLSLAELGLRHGNDLTETNGP